MESVWRGGVWTVFALALSGAFNPYTYILLAVCCVISAVVQFLILSHGKRWTKWLFLAIVSILILAAEITARVSYNYVQYFALLVIEYACAVFVGAVLATVVYWLCMFLKRKK